LRLKEEEGLHKEPRKQNQYREKEIVLERYREKERSSKKG
jgi:hypothetical protein